MKRVESSHTVRLILGDQLNSAHSWFNKVESSVEYVLMEISSETGYVRHHVQKVLAFFVAMRAFAEQLRAHGHTVRYITLDDPRNKHSFTENLRQIVSASGAAAVEYQLPDEYRLDRELAALSESLRVPCRAVESEHFFTTRDEFATIFKGAREYLMERFYRQMRKKHAILLEPDGKPVGGVWNLDAENRKKLPAGAAPPAQPRFDHDVSELLAMLKRCRVETIGSVVPEHLNWPTTRAESLLLLSFFVTQQLAHFGTYQDAMHTAHRVLYHSRISFALNTKMLSPREVIDAAIARWREAPEEISLAQIEGFVRQILGWREYMRGIYWMKMPEYRSLNFFNHTRALPHYYWDGDTKMRCVHHAVTQSLEDAYAHHIQRLMVTGNFALLAGVSPDELDAWYLGIYIDAIEWVELPNTRGMSQFADGGIVGTKPYISSANYIDKMSNYCAGCHYKKQDKVGERACPFNSLYWHFLERHRGALENNQRMTMMYRVLDKFDATTRHAILEHAERTLARIEDL